MSPQEAKGAVSFCEGAVPKGAHMTVFFTSNQLACLNETVNRDLESWQKPPR